MRVGIVKGVCHIFVMYLASLFCYFYVFGGFNQVIIMTFTRDLRFVYAKNDAHTVNF